MMTVERQKNQYYNNKNKCKLPVQRMQHGITQALSNPKYVVPVDQLRDTLLSELAELFL
jgi:hypothetical protein